MDWPELPYEAWSATKETLHMQIQMLGKLRLTLAPPEPEWAHIPLYVTARFLGKTFPVSFWWGSFDLSYSRFSGRGSEHASVGFWPGDERHPQAAFYAYTVPRPEGIEEAVPGWHTGLGEFVLPYDEVRSAADPRAALLDFAETTYRAGAELAGWPTELVSA